MRDLNQLVLSRLSKKLNSFKKIASIVPPTEGWIGGIRSAINMSRKQLAKKLGVTSEAVRQLEKREETGSITLRSLREAANAMDLQLVYALVPKEATLEKQVETQAKRLATKIVLRTNQQMKLEDQEVTDKRLKEAIEDATAELVRKLDKKIWDLK